MRWLLAVVALLASHTLGVPAADNSSSHYRCGTNAPPEFLELAKSMDSPTRMVKAVAVNRALEVKLYIHVVNTEDKEGTVTDEMIHDQYTVDDDWATDTFEHESDMKSKLNRGTYADLNLYFLSDFSEASLIGWCRLPSNESNDESIVLLDGCLIHAGALPGGYVPTRTLGKTATHEVGHWFGLLHVFQGESCTGDGDYVSDTNQQSEKSRGCPVDQDSCPSAKGLDNVNNYMDYADDECMTRFTEGQGTRMYQMWDDLRAGH